ncbi:hypothetical protein [Streptomyces canus]|uniref:hypothetical protein n=1 Tax=Streptomyces canus TaxID=58343 RepID=UPI002E2A2EE9|nr:hypothetical protein [Streptomyces canus]
MADGGYEWVDEGEKAVYQRAVRECLGDRRLSELLELRPAITHEAVAEAMSSSPYVERVLGEGRHQPEHNRYRQVLRLAAAHRWTMPTNWSPQELITSGNAGRYMWLLIASCIGGSLLLAPGHPWWFTIPGIAILVMPLGVPPLRYVRWVQGRLTDTDRRQQRRRAVGALLTLPWAFTLWCAEKLTEARWIGELDGGRLHTEVARAVEDLLGEDLGTLLVLQAHDGLSSPRQNSYFVKNASAAELARKMGQLSGGTIALSGPRGVGKTTLMEHSVGPDDFAVFAHAPAAYAPYDFLTSLFVSVCREYITRADYTAPEFGRLSYLHRVARGVFRPLGRLTGRFVRALPVVALMGLGLFAGTLRWFEKVDGSAAWRALMDVWHQGTGFLGDVVSGRAPAAALLLVSAGVLAWALSLFPPVVRVLRGVRVGLALLVVAALLLAPLISLFQDEELRRQFHASPNLWQILLIPPWLMCSFYASTAEADSSPRVGRWAVSKHRALTTLTVLLPFVFVASLALDRSARPLLTDSEHPIRIGAFLLGLLLARLLLGKRWAFLRPTPDLVITCRNHLYRLQTVQSSSAALTTGATQLLTLGSAHTSSVTTVPPNYPSLVGEFKQLLTDIGRDEQAKGNRVVIAIDEVDRLGTDTKALAFLAEIKAILGVPHVHYLISVAEDVGAAFVRRGLPNRDVTDSSLDDVVHVRRCTVIESARILKERAPGIGEAYIVLAHALSGGIPRDLIRYGRRLLEIQLITERSELTDVAQALIIEELSETLAGFRTLLAKQQWTPGTQGVLGSFRSLAAHLRVACPCREPMNQLHGALAHFVAYDVDGIGIPEESRRLIDEAAAYAYLSLTLLDIFGRPGFNQRRVEAARRSPDGNPDLLAEARQELAVSPYSTRPVIDGIRQAWLLDSVAAQGPRPTVMIPPPRGTACTAGHHPAA